MKRFKLFLAMAALACAIGLTVKYGSTYRPVVEPVREIEEIWALEDAREESEEPLVTRLFCNGVPMAYDAENNVFYGSLGLENGAQWPEIKLTASEEAAKGLSLCFADDYGFDDCDAAIREGYSYQIFAYTDTAYSYAEVVFTGLPLVNVTADQTIEREDVPAQIEIALAAEGLQTNGRIHKRGGASILNDKVGYKLEFMRTTDGKKKIATENVTATFIRSTKAYVYGYIYGNDVPAATEENRTEASDILWQSTPIDIKADTLQPVWVEFAIPKTAKSGTYKTQLTVTADQLDKPLVFEYEVRVQNAELPDNYRDTFDIELWQYPYTSAEYYNVEPFSDEHLEIMKSSMELYKKAGGHAITASIIEDAWDGQTYSANDVHYPSMIKWIKNGDSFTYDYTDFDKWVSFNKSLGIGDKIVLYSVAPWHNSFTYWENGKLVKEGFSVGSTRYTTLWTDFLTDLTAHLTEKGWFDDSYIGIDERGFSGTAFDLIESVKNKDGKCLKTAGAMDSFVEKKDLAMRVTDLNVGDTAAAAHPADFEQLVKDREAKGLRTTL